MLKIEDLHVHYGGIHAVKGVSLAIPKGAIVALVGANGAGKSSTVRAIAGLVRPSSGSIVYKDKEQLAGKNPEYMVRAGIALSPEGRRILPHLTVEENLRLGAYIRNDPEGVRKDMDWVFDLFPRLRERAWQAGGTLSGGEQQMLAVGRALMSKPTVLMMDEPSLGLAPIFVGMIFDIIREINASGVTVLLVEQNAKAALDVADTGYVMETGTISFSGSGKDLLADDRVRKAYLGEH